MRPWEIGRLTDWQIEHLYLRPAAERAKKNQGGPQSGGTNPGPPVDPFEGGLPPKTEFVAALMSSDGGTREHWSAVYDRLAAEQNGG